jgi:hypothetical protein
MQLAFRSVILASPLIFFHRGSYNTISLGTFRYHLVQDIILQNGDYLVSFDISLFTNVPVEEVLQVIRNRLSTDPSFPEYSPLQVEAVIEQIELRGD